MDQLEQPIRACLSEDSVLQRVTVEAINRRGKAIRCSVTCSLLKNLHAGKPGVILLMEDSAVRGQLEVPAGDGHKPPH